MNLFYTYGGTVEENRDPLKLGRLKVRVPHVFGTTGSGSGFVATNDLPWAMPAGMPAGGSGSSGGFSLLPANGDKVWVRFLDGEPEKPIWEWGMQSVDDRDALALHSYADSPTGVGAPNRTAWTRYSHAMELNAGGVIESTSAGYRILLNDSSTLLSFDGSIQLATPLGNTFALEDEFNVARLIATGDVDFQITDSFLAMSFDYTWMSAGDYTVDSAGGVEFRTSDRFEVLTAGFLNIDAISYAQIASASTITLSATANMALNYATLLLGAGATEPLVLGSQLISLLTTLLTLLDTHTHTSSTAGSPTSPPLVPTTAVIAPLLPTIVSMTGFTR